MGTLKKKNELIVLSQHPNLPSNALLLEAAKKNNCKLVIKSPDDFPLVLNEAKLKKGKSRPHVFLRTTGINFDEYDLKIAEYLQAKGHLVLNSPKISALFRSKLGQQLFFQERSLPSLPTFSFRGPLSGQNLKALQNFLSKVNTESFIVKTERGNQGKGVSLVEGEQSLYSWLDTLFHWNQQKILVQPFISKAIEYRALLLSGKLIGIVEKQTKSSKIKTTDNYKINFKHNASYTNFAPINSNSANYKFMEKQCSTILQQTGAFFLAVDFIGSKNKKIEELKILELGTVPGFVEFSRAMKMDVGSLIIEELKNKNFEV